MSELLLLWTLGRIALAQMGQMPPAPEALHSVLVYRDATYQYLAPGETPAEDAAQNLVAVWAWTETRPIQRLPKQRPREVLADLQRRGVEALEKAGAFREIRLQLPGDSPGAGAESTPVPPGFHVVAAPTAAWGQVPESLLPAWPIPSHGRVELPTDGSSDWRLRLVGPHQGSWWIDVPPGESPVPIAVQPGLDLSLRLVDVQGQPLPGATLYWLEAAWGQTSSPRIFARSLTDGNGEIFLPSLPDAKEMQLLVLAERKPPTTFRGYPGSLPDVLRLADGVEVRGTVVDERGRPLEKARILAQGWVLEAAGWPLTRRTTTGADGTWTLPALPAGPLVLTATRDGLQPHREEIRLEPMADPSLLDLPPWVLRPGIDLRVRVVDDLDQPVAGASVTVGAGTWEAATGPRGVANLEALPGDEPLRVLVTADGHLEGGLDVPLPLPEEIEVRLTRACRLMGRFITAREEPVADGTAKVHTGSSVRTWALEPGGTFDLPVRPGQRGELLLSSPETAELRVSFSPGAPGEVVDLGVLRAPRALRVTGRVVSEADGSPVVGARIWSLRASERGAAFAWMSEDVLQAATDAQGMFEIRGLPMLGGTLRVDATGYAREHVSFELGGERKGDELSDALDVGEIALDTGVILVVRMDEEMSPGAMARADLRGEWQEADFLSATFQGERAVLGPVPTGTATLTVWHGRDLLCEREVRVPADRDELEVECEGSQLEVVGTVREGGEPAGPGTLVWEQPARDGQPPVIQTIRGPAGLSRQQVLGEGRPPVRIAVASDGRFASDRLRAGAWEVTWQSEEQRAGWVDGTTGSAIGIAPPKRVRLGHGDNPVRVTLDFPASRLTGRIVAADGTPVPRARVHELDNGGFAVADRDGRFELAGLSPGRVRLQARAGERSSEIAEVDIPPDHAPEQVRLTLEADRERHLRLHVLDLAGRAVAGAFVFLEPEGEGLRTLTTRSDGAVEADLDTSGASRVRAAAFGEGAWALGEWISLEDALRDGGAVLRLSDPGGLRVSSDGVRNTVPVRSEAGWSLDRLLLRLGRRPSADPESPLLVSGLPPGRYFIGPPGPTLRTATVRTGEIADVEMD